MIDWNIQSRANACQGCGKPFLDKQLLHTLLFDQKSGYERLDVCEPCWVAQFSQGATSRKGFISHWQGVFEMPAVQSEPIRRENAESLLRKLVEVNDPKHGPACFILAVMLERKRVLKVKDQTQRDGQRVLLYEQPKTGDVFTISDPNLQLDQLDEVQRDVAQLLEHGLNPDAGTQSPAELASDNSDPQPAGAIQGGPETKPDEQTAVC
jgi:hypothetical protein